jgi:hypothetical protein
MLPPTRQNVKLGCWVRRQSSNRSCLTSYVGSSATQVARASRRASTMTDKHWQCLTCSYNAKYLYLRCSLQFAQYQMLQIYSWSFWHSLQICLKLSFCSYNLFHSAWLCRELTFHVRHWASQAWARAPKRARGEFMQYFMACSPQLQLVYAWMLDGREYLWKQWLWSFCLRPTAKLSAEGLESTFCVFKTGSYLLLAR